MSSNTGKIKSLKYAAPFCVVEHADTETERKILEAFGVNNNPYDMPSFQQGDDIIYGQ